MYAIIKTDTKVIRRLTDISPSSLRDGTEIVELSEENVTKFNDGQRPLFYIDGDIKTRLEKLYIDDIDSIKDSIRPIRNKLLGESDWTQLGDAPITAEKKVEWVNYRQSLRDLTDNIQTSGIVTYPTPPL